MKRRISILLLALLLAGCAGIQRGCSSMWAGATGADWIVVQYRYDGTPFAAWRLENVSISNEESSDGIYWLERSGHLVHLSGWYNRVQVNGKDWKAAGVLLGVDSDKIVNGKYKQ